MLATAQMALGRLDEALTTADECYAVMLAANGADHTLTADALFTRGRVRLRRAEYESATDDIEGALAIRATQFGETHPAYRDTLMLLAEAQLALGDVSAAEHHASRVLELVEANEPGDKAGLRRALTMLAQVRGTSGDLEGLRTVEARLTELDR